MKITNSNIKLPKAARRKKSKKVRQSLPKIKSPPTLPTGGNPQTWEEFQTLGISYKYCPTEDVFFKINKDKTTFPFASDIEMYFSWLCDELLHFGYLESYDYECERFKICDSLQVEYKQLKQLKTRTKVIQKSKNLLNEHFYTPDFKLVWSVPSKGKRAYKQNPFVSNWQRNFKLDKPFLCDNKKVTHIEIKPQYDYNNMTRHAVNNIGVVYDRHRVYIQLVKLPKFFIDFGLVPIRYLFTDVNKRLRKINIKNHKTILNYG